jgi:hypothetical protein
MAATFISQKIQGAIAEKAVKAAALWRGVAGKIFTFTIVKEFVTVFHNHGSVLFVIPEQFYLPNTQGSISASSL